MTTPQQIINLGTAANNGTGDNLRSAMDKVNNNFANTFGNNSVSSNLSFAGQTISSFNTNGDVILGPNGTGTIRIAQDLIPDTDNLRFIGNSNVRPLGAYIGTAGVITKGPVHLATFANAAVRDSTITQPITGMIINTANVFQSYNGTSWASPASSYGDSQVTALLANFGANVYSSTGSVTTTGNVTGANIITSGIVDATGNISTDGTLVAVGNITTTANISGGNLIGIPTSITVTTAAASGDGSLAYSASTGAFTFTPADAGQSDYGDSNVTTLLAALGANAISSTATITSTANITANLLKQTSNTVGIGNLVHSTSPDGDFATAVGFRAGSLQQGFEATAIGVSSGNTNQGNAAVAVGSEAGKLNQGFKSVAIGSEAGESTQGTTSVAVGEGAGESFQGNSSVALGTGAGSRHQGRNAVAIGSNAGQGLAFFPSYVSGGSGGSVTLVVSTTVGILPEMFVTGTGYTSNQTVSSVTNATTLVMNATSDTTPSGTLSFIARQEQETIAIGNIAGSQDQQSLAIAIGDAAGMRQDDQAIAIGTGAGRSSIETVAFVSTAGTALVVASTTGIHASDVITGTGFISGQTVTSVTDGSNLVISGAADSTPSGNLLFTGLPQGSKAIAIGSYTGDNGQSRDAIAIGHTTGQDFQGDGAIAIGEEAGRTNQGAKSIAIGQQSASTTQGTNAIAIGFTAGLTTQGSGAVAIGLNAGTTNQSIDAVAYGNRAGSGSQGVSSVALGPNSGESNLGQGAVAIGHQAGQTNAGRNSVSIGSIAGQSNQAANSIVISGTGNVVGSTVTGTLTIDPIRNDITSIGELLSYDATTKEVKYGNAFQIAGEAQAGSLDIIGTASVGTILTVTGNITGSNVAISGTTTSAVVSATNSMLMAVYANDTARNTGIPSPVAGQMIFKTDIAKLQFYTGAAWETVTST